MKKPAKTTPLPEVNFSDYGDVRCLHLGTEWI
jgi:spermidine synthase